MQAAIFFPGFAIQPSSRPCATFVRALRLLSKSLDTSDGLNRARLRVLSRFARIKRRRLCQFPHLLVPFGPDTTVLVGNGRSALWSWKLYGLHHGSTGISTLPLKPRRTSGQAELQLTRAILAIPWKRHRLEVSL